MNFQKYNPLGTMIGATQRYNKSFELRTQKSIRLDLVSMDDHEIDDSHCNKKAGAIPCNTIYVLYRSFNSVPQ